MPKSVGGKNYLGVNSYEDDMLYHKNNVRLKALENLEDMIKTGDRDNPNTDLMNLDDNLHKIVGS